jgi:hypothetical protein
VSVEPPGRGAPPPPAPVAALLQAADQHIEMLTTINLDLVKPKGIGRMRFSRKYHPFL